jgi:hypothetical protein
MSKIKPLLEANTDRSYLRFCHLTDLADLADDVRF